MRRFRTKFYQTFQVRKVAAFNHKMNEERVQLGSHKEPTSVRTRGGLPASRVGRGFIASSLKQLLKGSSAGRPTTPKPFTLVTL